MALSRRADLDTQIKALGYLIEKRVEWATTDEQWKAYKAEEAANGYEVADDDDRLVEEVWYVQYGPEPADVCRWGNAEFVMVPIDIGPYGWHETPQSNVVTRGQPAGDVG